MSGGLASRGSQSVNRFRAVASNVGRRVGAALVDAFVLFLTARLVEPVCGVSLWDLVSNQATRDALSERGSSLFLAAAITRMWPYTEQWYITMIVLSGAYSVSFVALAGATPGKMALGLRVVAADGSRATFSQALLRYVGYWISSWIWALGYAPILWGGRSLHDRLAGTRTEIVAKGKSRWGNS